MIGIFDSGLGGLTGVLQAERIFAGDKIIYFGDTGRVPYGTRSRETIIKYAMQDVRFLLSKNVDAILIACGTVSANALEELREAFNIPIVGVVKPAALRAAEITENGVIGIIGTSATVNSGAFKTALHEINPTLKSISVPCPLFVPLVENGFTDSNCEITRLTVEHYLRPIKNSGADTLILGCTHYPIIASAISAYLPGLRLVNTGTEGALSLAGELGITPDENTNAAPADVEYYVSDDTAGFSDAASLFLGHRICDRVQRIDIEKY